MKFIGILSVLMALTLSPANLYAIKLRYPIMLAGSLVNLFFFGMVGWQSVDSENFSQPTQANYDFNKADAELILLRKLLDSDSRLSIPYGINTLSRVHYDQILRDLARNDNVSLSLFSQAILEYLQLKNKVEQGQWGHPMIEPRLDLAYYYLISPNRAVPGVTGSINPFLAMREGIFTEDRNLSFVGAQFRGKLTRWFSYEVAPYALLASNDSGIQKNAEFYLKRGYGKFTARNLEFTLGKNSVEWGMGHYASLLFSGNAEAFYLFRIRNSQAVILPWFFRHLGPTQADLFFGVMDDNRTRPHSILAGTKLNFRPHPRFEFGIGQAVQFGGEGSNAWNPIYFLSDFSENNNAKVDRNFIVDLRYRIPGIEIEPYVELYWEDCCDEIVLNPRDVLNLVGIYIPNIGLTGKADFAIEWARTNQITYRHGGGFASGLYYKNHALGHPIGPDGTGVYGILRYFHTPRTIGKLVTAYEQRGRLESNAPEDRYRIQLELSHHFKKHFHLNVEAGYERVLRFNLQPGVHRHNFLTGFRLQIS